jgi:glycosyltransferase involved in cell wall biosynthesis
MNKPKKTKIAHILHSVGGVDVSLRLILENIDTNRFENIVIHGIEDTKIDYKDSNQQKITDFKLPLQRNINVLKDINSILKTIKILKKHQPDILHAHSAKGGIVAKITGKYLNIPVLHTPQAYSYLSASSKLKSNLYLLVEKLIKFNGNKILASSNSEKNRALHDVGYPKERVLLFNNSILPINHIKELSIEKTWPNEYICSVGRPSYQKNIELMLDALHEIKKQHSNIHLVLMGVGFHSPNLSVVKQKIKDLNLSKNITLLDWTKREDIFNIIKHSKLYFTTARYEGLPYSVIESLALGKPIVATDADGNRDLVKDNFNGFIIENENSIQLSSAVLKLLTNNELCKEFSANSKQLFLEKFNMLDNIKKLETIYIENKK